MLGCLIIFTPPISENCEIIKMCLQRKHFYQEEALGDQQMCNNNQGVLMLKVDCICVTEDSVSHTYVRYRFIYVKKQSAFI